jgi:hypothetical protein
MFWLVLSGCILAPWLILMLPKETFDRPILKPQEVFTPIKLSIDWNDGQAGLFSELGITQDQFIAWCVGVGQGKSLGENHWCGSKGVFSKGEYHIFRDELERRGLLRPKGRHHAQGFALSAKGEAVVTEVTKRFGDNRSPNYPRLDHQALVRPLPYLRESAREVKYYERSLCDGRGNVEERGKEKDGYMPMV